MGVDISLNPKEVKPPALWILEGLNEEIKKYDEKSECKAMEKDGETTLYCTFRHIDMDTALNLIHSRIDLLKTALGTFNIILEFE